MADATYRTALITGASSGLGRELALWFARRGTRVFAAARRLEQLEALSREAEGLSGRVEPVALDVAQEEATLEQVRSLDARTGGLDLVVANAGVGDDTPATRLDWAVVKRTLDVNVTGAAATLCAALPQMVERGRGHLVGVASLAAYRGLPRMAAYSASKAFLSTFCESLRVDLQGTGVQVTCIYPGFVKSEMTAKNKPGSMPFLLETHDAVDRMGRAIERGQATFAFPWPTATASRLLKAMPDALYTLAVRPRRSRKRRG